MKTFNAKQEDVSRDWYVVDLQGQTVGRAAAQIAAILRGKNKPTFSPNVDVGDYVVCINAKDVVFTGNKLSQKYYHKHSGFAGGLKSISAEKLLALKPEAIIETAVQGMLPKTKLGRAMISKLKVYPGADHPHAAQKPKALEL